MEIKLKLLPSFLPSLITYLITYWLTYFIRAPARTILRKFASLKYDKCLSSSSLCDTTWDKRSCHACGKSMLQSKITQFYYPKLEYCDRCSYNSFEIFKVHDRLVGSKDGRRPLPPSITFISCCWFCIYFKRIYFATPSDNCFWNVKTIFLTTIM